MKRVISLLAVLTMLLVPMISVNALTVSSPAQNAAANLAAPSTLTLSHTAIDKYPEGIAVYNAETDAITMTGINYGRSMAYTDAPAAIDGQNYVVTFTTNTKGWSNTWNLIVHFAKEGELSQSVSICDKYIAYTDAAGTEHQLAGTATNSANATVKVFVRKEANNTQGVFIYLNGTLKGEFHKQQDLVPTLAIYGAEGASAWQPVVRDIAVYSTGSAIGDVNADGSVNASDVTALSRYLANWDGYTAADINVGNADMDQDGAVTPLDEVALNRYFAGWLGYEAPYIPTIVVTDRGVDNTGATDVTEQLTALHATGKRIYYPNGTYLFNGETLDLSGGIEFQSATGVHIRNSITTATKTDIVNFDDNGNLIGLMQNHLEYKAAKKNDPDFVKTGSLVSPPISTKVNNTKVDFLPSWYNDGGLNYRFTSASGSVVWYDWSWNHADTPQDNVTLSFIHNKGTSNSSNFTISGLRVYKPSSSSTPYNFSGATNVLGSPNLGVEVDDATTGTWLNAILTLPYASNATFTQSGGYKYSADTYAIQFTVAAPNDANASLTVSPRRGENFVITSTGVTFNGTALTFANSSTATTDTVTYTLYCRRTSSTARAVYIYANGAYMKKGTANATFTGLSTRNVVYDDERHPLLGWYFGDEPTVLDWECYWMREYGIDQTMLVSEGVSSDPSNGEYWVYNLLNNTPNAKYMDFALRVEASNYGSDDATIRASWWNTFDQFYFNDQYKDQVYCYEEDGKRYPVVWLWDESSVRYSLSQNNYNVYLLYKDVADAFKENGYDGVCIMARTACMGGSTYKTLFANAGIKWFGIAYPQNCMGTGTTYTEKVTNFVTLSDTQTLYGVATGMFSHAPHPSEWGTYGSKATQFGNLIAKAVEATLADSTRAPIITCYNVAEWAEGGVGLVPTVGTGFDYLEAVRDNILVTE